MPLPPRALGVLALLVERAGRLVPKQLLLDTVWNDAVVTETSLTEAVSVLRQALRDNPQAPTYIQTVHRRGYRFIAAAEPQAPRMLHEPIRAGSRLPRRTGLALAIAAAALAAALAGMWQSLRRPAPLAGTETPRRLLIGIPPGAVLDAGLAPALALSPSGEQLIFVAREGGTQRLYLRALDRFEASPIVGSEGAAAPFFSPDGEWVGFFAHGKLEKVALAGGEPLAVCDSPYPYGASWGEDGSILFAPDYASGLRRAAAAGGQPTVLTTPDPRAGEIGHRWPEVLPGGRAALFTVWRRGGWKDASVELLDLQTGRRRELIRGGSFARYAPTGHLVFARAGGAQGLAAVAFDLGRLAVRGSPVAVLDGVRTDPAQGAGQFTLSRDGTLVYLPGGPQGNSRAVYLLAPAGGGRALPLPARSYRNLALSADGRRLALTVRELDRSELWVSEIDRGSLSRLTYEGDSIEPVWSPDGQWIAFAWARGGRHEIFRVAADGSRPPERLLGGGGNIRFPTSFSPDGRLLAFTEIAPATGADLWVLPLGGAPWPFLRTGFNEAGARFSPDGRWLAYESNESGSMEVYVRPFPGPGGKWQISVGGGSLPAWSADSRRVVYRSGTKLMAVELTQDAAGRLSAGPPHQELDEPELDRFALRPDGRSFLVFRRASAEPERLHVVLGFGRELARLAPAGGRAP
ncbi:MAG TPA: winged helix-turn-helix domain-containing protein [Thermoanaerobaculia bacterium]|nr:winged helix-turn-helix domain-containing protein [Thermoanaerobaculia bacterium]